MSLLNGCRIARANCIGQPQIRCLMLAIILLVGAGAKASLARGADDIDQLSEQTKMPAALRYQHGYSDFTDPLGRFLDLLAAGAFEDAKLLKPEACSTWLATRDASPFTGKVQIWDTQVDLDRLCRSQ